MKSAKVAVVLLALVALTTSTLAQAPGQGGGDVDKRKRKAPWFCHDRDCPRFKTLKEEPDYALRRYSRATWAVSCVFDVRMPDGVLLANARVLQYVRDNDLWGGTPFANLVHISIGNQAAWENATAPAFAARTSLGDALPSAADQDPAGPPGPAMEAALSGLHQSVCAAYFLPDKYQAENGTAEVDRRPPRPKKDSHIRIIRTRRFDAFVSGFAGFPTPPRFLLQSARLAHMLKWHGEDYRWGTALFYVYDPPSATTGRWNEVLIPARPLHDLLQGQGEDLYAGEGQAETAQAVV